MNDSTQNNRADRIIANQSGPQYANEGNVYANTGNGSQTNASGHANVNSGGGSGNTFVSGSAGDIATGGSKIVRRKFRFSPLLFLGHAAKTHPVASVVITLIVGAGAVSGGYVVTHAKGGTTPEAGLSPAASTANPTTSASSPTVVPVPPSHDTSWPQLGGGPARTGYQPGETRIGAGNVAKLALKRTYLPTPGGGGVSAPLIASGILYADVGNRLEAFDATGASGCADIPTTCTPLWTAVTAYFDSMTVADGDVFVTDAEGIQAFNAAGTTNCSGTPKLCKPLWATSTNNSTGPAFQPGAGSPVVVNGVLYIPGYGDGIVPSQGGAYVAAFDPAGSTDCSGTPVVCRPMWTTTGVPVSEGNDGSLTVANGVIYIAGGSTLYAFDATESAACSGTPKTCAPLWTGAMSGPGYPTVAVADGVVYSTTESGLYAFDAAGTRSCSTRTTAKTCAPLWTSSIPGGGALAIANGVVYLANGSTLYAFDADVPQSCPGTGATKTCSNAPLWSSAAGTNVDTASLTVANGVVYVTTSDGGIDAYDAAGSLNNCSVSGTAKTCTPLWNDAVDYTSGGSSAIVNGVLYVSAPGNGDVYALSS
jgi:PQQ-like domain